jgi:hypothetical protein
MQILQKTLRKGCSLAAKITVLVPNPLALDYTRLQMQTPKIIIPDMVKTTQDTLSPLLIGGGTVETIDPGHLRLSLPQENSAYCDAQLDDYHALPRRLFRWRPPLSFHIQARASHQWPVGTLGFGFWNDPFTLSFGQGGAARRIPAPPQALWYFYGSQENELPLNPGKAKNGWKASSLNFPQLHPLVVAPTASIALILLRLGLLREAIIQRAIRSAKAVEADLKMSLTDWHDYAIEWKDDSADFYVDDTHVLSANNPPRGPLGFVVWIDNQFAVVSIERGVYFGITPTEKEQWLEIKDLEISI